MENLTFSEWNIPEYRRLFTTVIVPPSETRVQEMCNAFATILLGRRLFAFNMARTALMEALRIFHRARPHAGEVIVPSYICPAVIEAVHATGLRPVACDVGLDLNIDVGAIEGLISSRTLAVLVAHMYGCPARITEIAAICQRYGVFLVDDAAQAPGISIADQPLGTFGDVGLISFSQSKSIVTGCRNAGGLLIVNNSQFEKQAAAAYEDLPPSPPCIPDLMTFFWNYRWAQWTEIPSYYFARVFRASRWFSNLKPKTASRMSDVVAAIALEQHKTLQTRIAGRRRIVELYNRKIDSQRAIAFPQFGPGRYLTRIMLTIPLGADAMKVRHDLARKGICTRRGYPVYSSSTEPCPKTAWAISPRLIEVPSCSTMSAETVDRICCALNKSITDAALRE